MSFDRLISPHTRGRQIDGGIETGLTIQHLLHEDKRCTGPPPKSAARQKMAAKRRSVVSSKIQTHWESLRLLKVSPNCETCIVMYCIYKTYVKIRVPAANQLWSHLEVAAAVCGAPSLLKAPRRSPQGHASKFPSGLLG